MALRFSRGPWNLDCWQSQLGYDDATEKEQPRTKRPSQPPFAFGSGGWRPLTFAIKEET